MSELLLEVDNVSKSFPGVRALDGVNLAVRAGSVHAVCGENGAGKSTLMKIINGIYQPDEGTIRIRGEEAVIKNPIDARASGIAMIAQELNYVPDMTIAESLFIGRLPMKHGRVDWKFIRQEAQRVLQAEGLEYSINRKLRSLTVAEIQTLEIVRSVYHSADIFIMDEPTSSIAHKEVRALFEKIEKLRAEGKAILYISHKMDEVFELADDVTVLRDGAWVSSRPASETTPERVISEMVGRDLNHQQYPKEAVPLAGEVLRVTGLASDDLFEDVSLHVRAGEIVGLAGLVGAGRSEVVRGIVGLEKLSAGTIEIDGQAMPSPSPKRALDMGVVMLSEDRRLSGIIPEMSIKHNATLASLKKVVHGGYTHSRDEHTIVSEHFQRMQVKAPSVDIKIESLSGGNQQKVLLARWLIAEPKMLLLDEPTRGIDIGAKWEIYKIMTDLTRQGKGILMISSELPELIGMCDRIYVMSAGRITAELQRDEFNQESILKYAMAESEAS